MLANILLVLHLLVAVAIVILVLLQQGKGADMGAAFGGGSSQTLFGARGSANFLSRTTSILATVFFLTSMTLAYMYTRQSESSIASGVISAPAVESTPADVPPIDAEIGETPVESGGDSGEIPSPPE